MKFLKERGAGLHKKACLSDRRSSLLLLHYILEYPINYIKAPMEEESPFCPLGTTMEINKELAFKSLGLPT